MKSGFSFFAAFLLLFATAGTAETFVVNKEADDNGPCTPDDCSLREALIAANEHPDHDTVIVPAGTYKIEIPGLTLTAGSFDIDGDVDVLGEPGVYLVGNGEDRVVIIYSGRVLLSQLDISGGDADGNGGGIRSTLADVTIVDSTIHHNVTNASGGGVANLQGTMVIDRSTIYANEARTEGGGVYSIGIPVSPVSQTIMNSTISGNHGLQGGGVGVEGRVNVLIRDTTIADNTVSFRAGAFYTDGAPPARLSNTIFVGTCGQNLIPESSGGNIESPGETCFLDDPTDRMGVANPGLGPLGDYGGPTQTHALLAGSPAIDTAVGSCEPTDQRGVDRPVDGDGDGTATCDVGAFEFVPEPSVVEVPSASRVGLMALAAWLAGLGIVALGRRG